MDFKLIFRVEKIPVASDIIYSRPYRKGGGDYRHYKRKETLGREHYRFKQNDDYTKELRNRFYFTQRVGGNGYPRLAGYHKAHGCDGKLAEHDYECRPQKDVVKQPARDGKIVGNDKIRCTDRYHSAEYHEFVGKRVDEFAEPCNYLAASRDFAVKKIRNGGKNEYGGGNYTRPRGVLVCKDGIHYEYRKERHKDYPCKRKSVGKVEFHCTSPSPTNLPTRS